MTKKGGGGAGMTEIGREEGEMTKNGGRGEEWLKREGEDDREGGGEEEEKEE